MAVTVQVAYPSEGTRFDHAYYAATHMPLVMEHLGPKGLVSAAASRGVAGGAPGAAAPFHAIATLTWPDLDTLQAGMAEAGPVLEDIPNFTDARPLVMIGEVIGG